jgi:hypothetical protein
MMKSSQSPARQALIDVMQNLNFGRIENLLVCQGEPVFNPTPPRIVRDIKLGGENGARPEATISDFALKTQVTELFEHLRHLGDGSVRVIEVKHGLPFRLVIEQPF